jgi:hypothetical protein
MKYFRVIFCAFVIFTFAGIANALSVRPLKETSLPKLDASNIEQITCLERHKLNAEIITGYRFEYLAEPSPLASDAYVRCRPHGKFKDNPIYFAADCHYLSKKWTCGESKLHISVTINNRKVDVVPGSTKHELAEDVLKKISRHGEFQGTSIDKAIGNRCEIYSGSDPEELRLKCELYIDISFRCPQAKTTDCPRVLFLSSDQFEYSLRRKHAQ